MGVLPIEWNINMVKHNKTQLMLINLPPSTTIYGGRRSPSSTLKDSKYEQLISDDNLIKRISYGKVEVNEELENLRMYKLADPDDMQGKVLTEQTNTPTASFLILPQRLV